MIKRFCDICEAPSVGNPIVEVKEEYGEEYRRTKSNSLYEETVRPKIVLRAVATLIDHPAGYGGPPDLCAECLNKMLARLKYE